MAGEVIECPACGGQMTIPSPPPSSGEFDPNQEWKILVVDDDKAIRDMFSTIISSHMPNCTVDLAVNGKEGVEAFKKTKYNLIIMDLKMPVVTGDVAFRQIQDYCDQEKKTIPPVVFCTGYNPPSVITKLVKSEPKHCLLIKPVSIQNLIRIIKEKMAANPV